FDVPSSVFRIWFRCKQVCYLARVQAITARNWVTGNVLALFAPMHLTLHGLKLLVLIRVKSVHFQTPLQFHNFLPVAHAPLCTLASLTNACLRRDATTS